MWQYWTNHKKAGEKNLWVTKKIWKNDWYTTEQKITVVRSQRVRYCGNKIKKSWIDDFTKEKRGNLKLLCGWN